MDDTNRRRDHPENTTLVRNPVMPVLTRKKDHHGKLTSDIHCDYVSLSGVVESLISVSDRCLLNEAPLPLLKRISLMREKHGPHPTNPSFTRFLALRLVAFDRVVKACLILLFHLWTA